MDLAFELHDLVLTLDRTAERLLTPHGLSYNRYVALVVIAEHPGVTGRLLSNALRVSEAAAGLIDDVAPGGAGHVRHLQITPAGSALVEQCSQLLGSSLDAHARAIGIDPQSLAHTIRALHDELRTGGRTTTTEEDH